MLVARDLAKCEIGQCKYVFVTAPDGGIINDPVLLRLGEDHFWLSPADSDVLLWARGVAHGSGLDVTIREPLAGPEVRPPRERQPGREAGDTERDRHAGIEAVGHGERAGNVHRRELGHGPERLGRPVEVDAPAIGQPRDPLEADHAWHAQLAVHSGRDVEVDGVEPGEQDLQDFVAVVGHRLLRSQ
jgi:hypothetical protein